jgi:alpha-D-xyloside xylohydrolase
MQRLFLWLVILLACWINSTGLRAAPLPVISTTTEENRLVVHLQQGTLQLQFCGKNTVHVIYRANGPISNNPTGFAVQDEPKALPFRKTENPASLVIKTSAFGVSLDKNTGALTFLDADGQPFLEEVHDDGRTLTPSTVAGVATNTVDQKFILDPNEGMYGLGQRPNGVMNYVGSTVHLQQKNMDVAIPVLLSSKGYGVFWNNPAITDVTFSKATDPNPTVEWKSQFGSSIDYYVFYGPTSDQVIAAYRKLTGTAPMFPRWAWGFWQCKEHYATQQELLDVAARYRAMQVPIDAVIQDWFYWNPHPWGSHQFDLKRYPNITEAIQKLHDENVHIIISVWAKFEPGSANADALRQAGDLYENPHPHPASEAQYYDSFKPEARKLYWEQISKRLFADGFDGWWLDASEAELNYQWGEFTDYKTAAGPGAAVYNAYPLMHTSGVYQGQRAENPNKRVFILTRSAYAGQQRNAAVTWSGDVEGAWDVYRDQIPDGLNFSYSGIPYWNTDIGGFLGKDPADPAYAELFTRWFQFGSFCPMFRVHGTNFPKEMWRFPAKTEGVLIDFDKLRYHLLPYIYSVSWKVTHEGYSMMRGLVMDFQKDPKVANIPDQYLFGPAIMVNPVTTPSAGAEVAIPPSQLLDQAGQPGALTGTYFQGENFEQKKLERRDPAISFDWTNSPDPSMQRTDFSVRWEGSVLTQKAGDYTFSLEADDGMRLWVDGKLVIDNWVVQRAATKWGVVNLPANSRVPIKIEYFQDQVEASIDLKWAPPRDVADPFTRQVYLPAATSWTDFWTGETLADGQTVSAKASIETMPLYVRAGSILPYGPDIQYATQTVDPLELRVYRGADGAFTLYEDENDNYNYEKGVYATIPFSWSEKDQVLTIGQRQGHFPGMLKTRTFRIVWVSPGHGAGIPSTASPDAEITYEGDVVQVPFSKK